MAISARFALSLLVNELLDSGENRGPGPIPHRFAQTTTIEDGTTDGKCDLAWSDRRTVIGSGNTSIDLAGSLTDSFGATVTFAEVVLVIISVRTSGGSVDAGPHATNGWLGPWADASDRIEVAHGFPFCVGKRTGWSVTAGTGDVLYIANNGAGDCEIDIFILGRSA